MSFRYERDKPLPKGLVHGITSIWLESSLEPAKPPKSREKSQADADQSTLAKYIEGKDEQPTNSG